MNRRALRVLLTALSAAALALVGATVPAAAAAGPGQISVTVLASDTGAPILGACVAVYDSDGIGPLASDCDVAGTGVVTVSGLTDGTGYKVFSGGDDTHIGEWLFGADDSSAATVITAPADVTASLRLSVPTSGTLTRTDGTPVADGSVVFQRSDGSEVYRTFTAPDGTWSQLVAVGEYRVLFSDGVVSNYAVGKADLATADPVTAVAGTPLVLDDVLPFPGAVTGRVLARGTTTPLAGMCVVLAPADSPGSADGGACTTTSAAGRFRITPVPAGSYVAVVTDPAANRAFAVSKPFTVVDGATTTGVGLSMAVAGSLSGVLVDAATRVPLKGICPAASFTSPTAPLLGTKETCTGATGRFRIKGLPAGRFVVQLSGDARHPLVWAPLAPTRALATKYLVTAGANTALGTIAEPLGGTLAGRITGPDGAGLPGVFVSPDGHPGRAGPGEGLHVAVTDANGNYVIRNLPKWNAPVVVYPDIQPLGVRWSGNATDPAKATPVLIGWNRRSTFDLQLQPEARLAVTLTGAAGSTDVLIDPVGSDGSIMGFGNDLIGDGTTTLGQLPGGGVRLRITLFPGNRVFYYDGASTAAAATAVPTTAGATTAVTVTVPPA